jgi:hypothetical protein
LFVGMRAACTKSTYLELDALAAVLGLLASF